MKSTTSFLLLLALLTTACQNNRAIITKDDLNQITTLVLVRHAEKAEDGNSDPGLTPLGQVRAQKLAAMLSPTGVDAIYSTPYDRTRLTAKPLADLVKLPVKEYDPWDKDLIDRLLNDHRGETLLIVGHSNTIPNMVNALIGQPKYQQLDDLEYDKLFIVEVIKNTGRELVLSF